MKTIEAFLREIDGSAALQDEFKAIKDKDALAAFLKKHDVEGTVEDFGKAIEGRFEAEGEISDEAAEGLAGGSGYTPFWIEEERRKPKHPTIKADRFVYEKLTTVFGAEHIQH